MLNDSDKLDSGKRTQSRRRYRPSVWDDDLANGSIQCSSQHPTPEDTTINSSSWESMEELAAIVELSWTWTQAEEDCKIRDNFETVHPENNDMIDLDTCLENFSLNHWKRFPPMSAKLKRMIMSVKKLTTDPMGAFITRFKVYQYQIGNETDNSVILDHFLNSLSGFIGYGTMNVVHPSMLEDAYEMAMRMEGTYEPHMLQLDVWRTFGPEGAQGHNMPPLSAAPSPYVLPAPPIPVAQVEALQMSRE
ncbi:hypothetical protein R1flu_005543 [Riccia fluitans]|uniref:Retrotransposon gag domain-containing protein n=1 Tax=Riccia fluitans TaxID=41844 RepID=A0ABD1YUF1_9MARC